MDSLGSSGLSLAFRNNDKVMFNKSFRVMHIETKKPVIENTVFDAVSILKTVFGFMVMQTVDRGLVNHYTPLYSYFENLDIAYDERYKKIITRMALSHTSGFPNWRYLTDNGYDPNGKLRIDFEPGAEYRYSGDGYQYG